MSFFSNLFKKPLTEEEIDNHLTRAFSAAIIDLDPTRFYLMVLGNDIDEQDARQLHEALKNASENTGVRIQVLLIQDADIKIIQL